MSFRAPAACLFFSLSCCAEISSDSAGAPLAPYPGAWLPGGKAGTNRYLFGSNAFIVNMPGLTAEHERMFYSGNGFFNQSWVEAPASTEAIDGLGPYHNATGCSGCHFKDGRAAPPEDGPGPFVGLLLRMSIPGGAPEPTYGGQVQDLALPHMQPELTPVVSWNEVAFAYPDGTVSTLLRPDFALTHPADGPLDEGVQLSARLAMQVIGLGLLEAIPEADLVALADPDDADSDGISGRVPWVTSLETGEQVVGRLGWKGETANTADQTAKALAGDLGLTSRLVPADDCTDRQIACLAEPSGGVPEVSDEIFDRLVLYSRALAVPARTAADDPDILQGRELFEAVGCADCHVSSHRTGPGPLPELADQLIWPYTDLLLHDLGPGLSDGRPLGEAGAQEWQTRPLWGIGHLQDVNGHTRLLHDGRARGVAEAILWHGGEAQDANTAFQTLSAADRDRVVAFVEDL